ncbi:hypothetical protein BG000_011205 [Podila horticola]|nr:hypothetical protein BG000_011205 [Podila horticola]
MTDADSTKKAKAEIEARREPYRLYGSKTAAIEGSVINTGSKNYPQFKIEAFVLTGRKGKTGEPAKAPSATEAPDDMADSMPETCEIKPESDTKCKEAIANKPTPDPGASGTMESVVDAMHGGLKERTLYLEP